MSVAQKDDHASKADFWKITDSVIVFVAFLLYLLVLLCAFLQAIKRWCGRGWSDYSL